MHALMWDVDYDPMTHVVKRNQHGCCDDTFTWRDVACDWSNKLLHSVLLNSVMCFL
jgi:hypothetical protein